MGDSLSYGYDILLLVATYNVCTLEIEEFFAQTRVSDYWQLIHWAVIGVQALFTVGARNKKTKRGVYQIGGTD